ncbi:glycosyltransferase family 2 protein [Patescibacteria group bacterium]|nr:glycosyltransferase family 2 protein [Patescibacteria group bacterium]
MTKVAVIILSWNVKKDTIETIKSLLKSEIKGFSLEVVVVDNGSTDGSPQAIKKLFRELKLKKEVSLKLIELHKNVGFAEGNNVGMRYALRSRVDYVVLLNDDTIVDKNLIVSLVEAAKRYKKAGAISPKIYFVKGYEFHKERYKKSELGNVIWYAGGDIDWDNVYGSNYGVDEVDRGQHDEVRETDFTTGCCVIFPERVLKSVGLYDKRYFAYLEDADLSQRIREAGWKVLYSPNAHLWHKVAQSSGIGSDLNDYFLTRNRMLFGMRYASLRTRFALLRESLRLLVNGRKWQRIGIRDFYFGRLGKGSWR